MKRLTLLVVLLGVMGLAAGFALEVKPALTLTGSATLTWGVDLNDFSTGFTNAGSADLTITLLAKSSDTHEGKTGLYGSITISNLSLTFLDGAAKAGDAAAAPVEPTVAAKLVAGPISVGINAAPGMSSDVAAQIETDTDADDANLYDNVIDEEADFGPAYSGNGTWVKYTADMFSVTFDIKSEAAHVANNSQAYAIGLEGSVTAVKDLLKFGVGAFYGFNYAAGNPLNAYVSVTLTPAGMGTVALALDATIVPTFVFEPAAVVTLNLNKEATAYVKGSFLYRSDDSNLDTLLNVMIPSDTLLGALNFDTTVEVFDLLTTLEYGILVDLGYKAKLSGDMYVRPNIAVKYAAPNVTPAQTGLYLTPAVEIGLSAAPLMTLTAAWTSGNLLAATADLGALTFALKVTY